MRWLVAFVFLLCALPAFAAPAFAESLVVTADHAVSGDEIALRDGRVLRLAGIKSFTPDAQEFLQSHLAGRDLVLQNPVIDRYGRVFAVAIIMGETQNIEQDMLQQGLAFVYLASGDDAHLDSWMMAELAARMAGRGAWPQHADIASDDAEKNADTLYGSYVFVSGVVTKAERVKNKVYLDFGADWRTDFTIAIAAHDLRAFRDANKDPLDMGGKRVRVRGWVKRDFGPMITATDPRQVEIIP